MNDDRLHSRRMTMMATAIEIMEVLHREGHTVRSALAELGTAPKRGRGATWEDVTRRVFTLLEADERGIDLLSRWRGVDIAPQDGTDTGHRNEPVDAHTVIVRLPALGKPRPAASFQRAQKLEGAATIEEPTPAQRMVRR